jgi:hypothetical protein
VCIANANTSVVNMVSAGEKMTVGNAVLEAVSHVISPRLDGQTVSREPLAEPPAENVDQSLRAELSC